LICQPECVLSLSAEGVPFVANRDSTPATFSWDSTVKIGMSGVAPEVPPPFDMLRRYSGREISACAICT
jgi:hypothetical protein